MSISSVNNDRVYYAATIRPINLLTGYSQAVFRENFTTALINKCSDWYLTVTHVTCPIEAIPIFIPRIEPFFVSGNTNINKTVYVVSLEYNGFSSGPVNIIYVPQNQNVTIPIPLSAASPIQQKTDYYFVYNYTWWQDIVNTALITAFNQLNVASGFSLPLGSVAPYITFDINYRLFELVAQVAFYDRVLITPINIFMNFDIFTLFDGLPHINVNPTGVYNEVQLIVENQYDNFFNPSYLAPTIPPSYYVMRAEFGSLLNMSPLRNIVITSASLPIRDEIVPLSTTGNGQVNYMSVVRNLEVNLDNFNRSTIEYKQSGPYHLTNFLSDFPLTTVDLSVFWISKFGDVYPLLIPYNNIINIKMEFIRKSTFTS